MTPREGNLVGSAAVLEAVRTGRVRDVEAERREAAEESALVAMHGPLRLCSLFELNRLRADAPHLDIESACVSQDGRRTVLVLGARRGG